MNAVGLIDCFIENFGTNDGNWQQWMPEGFWWQYMWSTIVLVICTTVCLAGSGLFARCSNGLLAILLIATFSIPFSTLFVTPFESRKLGIQYTGLSLETLTGNLLPRFTKGAAGSQINQRENFQDLFGILFPATGGIFALVQNFCPLAHIFSNLVSGGQACLVTLNTRVKRSRKAHSMALA